MRSYLIAFCCCIGCWLTSGAQHLDSTLARYADSYQPEKLYLQYDKATYAAGETIWFKAYLMDGFYPAAESKTLYIDWIGDKGEVLSHHVLPLVDGTSNGQFEIPAEYKGGAVHVRGYTRWMLNFDSAFLYSKDIRVIGAPTAAKPVSKPVILSELTFFPEGGEAIAGLTNKIAFKATDQWGRPVKAKGVIEDAKGAALDSFESVHDGMGFFYFIPQANTTYTARWKDETGKSHATPLPVAKAEGLTMQVRVSGAKRMIAINATPGIAGALKQLHMIGTSNNTQVFRADVALNTSNNALRTIVTSNLPTGILTITLFDDSWNAVAERITFINNNNYSFQPGVEVQHWGLNRRARNELKISLPDSVQRTNLSVAITDLAIDTDSSQNIISGLLLTSDIRGKVHNPAYYFSGTADSLAQHLDLVMLTNGWRRFKWEDLAHGKLPVIKYPKDTSYLSLSGKLVGVSKGMLSGKEAIAVFLTGKDSTKRIELLPVGPDGSFSNPSFIFFDTLRVYYHLKSKLFSNAEAHFMTDRLAAPNYTAFARTFNIPTFSDTTGQFRNASLAAENLRLRMQQSGKMLENITVTAHAKKPEQVLDEKYSKGLFSGGDAYQFDLVNDPFAAGRTDIFQFLQGKVPGLQINGNPGAPSVSWRGGTPQFYLDELPVDIEMMASLPVSDVAYVKVFRPPFMGGFGGGAGGAIAVYTRKGDDQRSTPASGMSSNLVYGYTPIKEFYSPNYESLDRRNDQRDLRTTLYWNPFIELNAKKKSIVLRFFNNDVTRAFRVVIEGMTPDGLLTHYETVLE